MTSQPTPTTPPTFRVLADALPYIETRLEAAAKKAVKLGFPAPKLTVERWINVKEEGGKVIRYAEISVEGDAPKLNGWTFVASLQILDREAVIRTVPGQSLPEQYREADPTRCEHCKLNRRRNDTYVLVHENGDARQVGSTCLSDFLGHPSPEAVAKYADLLFKIRESCEAAESKDWYASSGGGQVYRVDLAEFLAATAEQIREHGWVSAKEARERETEGTARLVWNKFFPVTRSRDHKAPKPTDADRERAAKAQEWAEALPEEAESDYLHNLRVIAGFGAVEYKLVGFAGSILVAYDRAQRDAERASRPNGWFGKVGEKRTFNLKFVSGAMAASGSCYVARFANDEGFEAVSFFPSDPKLVPGRIYTVNAKVSGHDTYRGVKSTKLSYASFKAEQPEAKVVESATCPF